MATASVAVMRSLPLTLFPPYSTTDFTILNTHTHTHGKVTSCPVIPSWRVGVRHYPAVSLRHAPPAQLVHQGRQDAAAVAFVSQSVEHDEAGGVPLRHSGVLEEPPDLLRGDSSSVESRKPPGQHQTTGGRGTSRCRLGCCLAAFIVNQSHTHTHTHLIAAHFHSNKRSSVTEQTERCLSITPPSLQGAVQLHRCQSCL